MTDITVFQLIKMGLSAYLVKKNEKKIWQYSIKTYFCTPNKQREHSSAGLEHLPYKQRVRGSNPCAPTK
jgi:hypothetical protein